MRSSQILAVLSFIAVGTAWAAPVLRHNHKTDDIKVTHTTTEHAVHARAPISLSSNDKKLLVGLAIRAGLSALTGRNSGGSNRARDNETQTNGKPAAVSDGSAPNTSATIGDGSATSTPAVTDVGNDSASSTPAAVSDGSTPNTNAAAKSDAGSVMGKTIACSLGSALGRYGGEQLKKAFPRRDGGDELLEEKVDGSEREPQTFTERGSLSHRQSAIAKAVTRFGIRPIIDAVAANGIGPLMTEALTCGIGSAIADYGVGKLRSALQRRDLGGPVQEEMSELERQLGELMSNHGAGKRSLEARELLDLNSLVDEMLSPGALIDVGSLVGAGLDALQGILQRNESLEELR